LPRGAGRPSDIVRFRDRLLVLTESKLLSIEDGAIVEIASWTDPKLFAVDDLYCAAPLAVFENELYAGSPKDVALYRFNSERRRASMRSRGGKLASRPSAPDQPSFVNPATPSTGAKSTELAAVSRSIKSIRESTTL